LEIMILAYQPTQETDVQVTMQV